MANIKTSTFQFSQHLDKDMRHVVCVFTISGSAEPTLLSYKGVEAVRRRLTGIYDVYLMDQYPTGSTYTAHVTQVVTSSYASDTRLCNTIDPSVASGSVALSLMHLSGTVAAPATTLANPAHTTKVLLDLWVKA